MNKKEKTALQNVHLLLVEDLNAKDILPHLFQNKMITIEEYEEIDELNETRRTKCKKLLRFISRSGSKCTFEGFVQSLRYNNTYFFLADKLEQKLKEVLEEKDDTLADILYEPVRKINVFTKQRKAMSALAHKLKRLSHDGDYESFQKVVKTIDTKFQRNKLMGKKSIGDRMELADMRFTSLEAEISAKRVRYDTSLGDGDVFKHMESVIPFTRNPRVSSMTYLARYGSAVAMENSIDDGLAYIQFAKEHAEHVAPCKDTGMVYYIEVNLLSQKYEKNPTDSLKADVLRTSEQGIAQFNSENEEIRKDYQRMLLLKMVYCYLGVGLFCRKIENARSTVSDRDEAKKVIDFIETSDVWQGMEKRRKMLFFVAKSEYYKQQGNMDLAVVHAKEAQKLGKENKWNAELPNICEMLSELKHLKSSNSDRVESKTAAEIVAELFEDFSENEDESEEGHWDNTCTASGHINETSQGYKDLGDLYLRTMQGKDKSITHMHDLKDISKEFDDEMSSDFTNSHRITLLKELGEEYDTRNFETEQRFEEGIGSENKFEQNTGHVNANLDATENSICMTYFKPEDNINLLTREETEMACLKDPYEMQCFEESLPKLDSQYASHRHQQLMLLKEQSPVGEMPFDDNLSLTLHTEDNSMTVQSQNSNITSLSQNGELPSPLL